jgi:hypothetical protein
MFERKALELLPGPPCKMNEMTHTIGSEGQADCFHFFQSKPVERRTSRIEIKVAVVESYHPNGARLHPDSATTVYWNG